jgi:hypothetical protein
VVAALLEWVLRSNVVKYRLRLVDSRFVRDIQKSRIGGKVTRRNSGTRSAPGDALVLCCDEKSKCHAHASSRFHLPRPAHGPWTHDYTAPPCWRTHRQSPLRAAAFHQASRPGANVRRRPKEAQTVQAPSRDPERQPSSPVLRTAAPLPLLGRRAKTRLETRPLGSKPWDDAG